MEALIPFLWTGLRIISFSFSLMVNPHKWTDITRYYVPCVFCFLEDLLIQTGGCWIESWMHGRFSKTSSISEFAVFDTSRIVASSNFALWIWITSTRLYSSSYAFEKLLSWKGDNGNVGNRQVGDEWEISRLNATLLIRDYISRIPVTRTVTHPLEVCQLSTSENTTHTSVHVCLYLCVHIFTHTLFSVLFKRPLDLHLTFCFFLTPSVSSIL